LRELLAYVRPGGLLFVEGPLEDNPSPVFWAASLFGTVKRRLQPGAIDATALTHLLRFDPTRQQAFFTRVDPSLTLAHWEVRETGWPYAHGGTVKRAIASLARALGGRMLLGAIFTAGDTA
jgi:hypothetical protein